MQQNQTDDKYFMTSYVDGPEWTKSVFMQYSWYCFNTSQNSKLLPRGCIMQVQVPHDKLEIDQFDDTTNNNTLIEIHVQRYDSFV